MYIVPLPARTLYLPPWPFESQRSTQQYARPHLFPFSPVQHLLLHLSPPPHPFAFFVIPHCAVHSLQIRRVSLSHLPRVSCPLALRSIHLYTPHSTIPFLYKAPRGAALLSGTLSNLSCARASPPNSLPPSSPTAFFHAPLLRSLCPAPGLVHVCLTSCWSPTCATPPATPPAGRATCALSSPPSTATFRGTQSVGTCSPPSVLPQPHGSKPGAPPPPGCGTSCLVSALAVWALYASPAVGIPAP